LAGRGNLTAISNGPGSGGRSFLDRVGTWIVKTGVNKREALLQGWAWRVAGASKTRRREEEKLPYDREGRWACVGGRILVANARVQLFDC